MRPAILLPFLLFACSPQEPGAWDDVQRAESPIVNGQAESGHPEVGLLYLQGQPACTATLIGSRTVLTAAHCVTNEKQPPFQLISPISFKLAGQMYMAASVVMHQGYGWTGGSWVGDVAVVRLGQAVQGVTPTRITSAAPQQGETVTLVGYGYTSDTATSSFGVKRKATNTIGNMTQNLITFYGATGSVGNICFGDSGGPAFAVRGGVEYQVGVHSFGESDCGVTEHDQRVDFYHGWITSQAQGDLYTGPPEQPPPADQDTKPPTVQFVTPSDSAQLGPSFQVHVAAQDDVGVVQVDLFIDGKQALKKVQPPYRFQLTELATGEHNLRAEALDQVGHRSSTLIKVQVREGLSSTDTPADQPSLLHNPQDNPGGELLGSCSYAGSSPSCSLAGLLLLALAGLVTCRRRRS